MNNYSGFVGNENEYNQLFNWINQPVSAFGKTLMKDCVCIISGGPGCGKTYGINKAINDAHKNICYINKDECVNSKDFKELLLKQTKSNILDQFNLLSLTNDAVANDNTLATETIVFIDDVDTLLSIDRSFINNFNLLITSNSIKSIKIIVSCITSEVKLILKSIIFGQLIILKPLSEYDIKHYLYNINNNNQNVSNIDTIINNTIKMCNGNLSVALNNYYLTIRKERIHNQIDKSDQTTDIFPEVAKIYFMEDRNLIRKIIELDPWLHPLRFHENIIHEFKQRKGTKDVKSDIYINILKNLCQWDQLMTNSKGGDITYAIEQGCNTVMLLTDIKRKKNAEEPMDEFTRMFNYLSLRKKNMVSLYEGNFPWETIGSSRKKIYEGYIRKEINSNKVRKVRTRNNTKKLSI